MTDTTDNVKHKAKQPLPCPFCGEQPSTEPTHPERQGNAWGAVRCVNTECPAQPRVGDGVNIADERGTAAYIAAAVRRWNRRARAKALRNDETRCTVCNGNDASMPCAYPRERPAGCLWALRKGKEA